MRKLSSLSPRLHAQNFRHLGGIQMPTILISDSTSNIMMLLGDIIDEWEVLHRRGKIIIHMDGAGPKKIQFDYSLDL